MDKWRQDFKSNTGHHTESENILGFEIFQLPNEIIFKIFNNLDILTLHQCCQVSKSIKRICSSLINTQLKSNLVLVKAIYLVKEEKNLRNYLFDETYSRGRLFYMM